MKPVLCASQSFQGMFTDSLETIYCSKAQYSHIFLVTLCNPKNDLTITTKHLVFRSYSCMELGWHPTKSKHLQHYRNSWLRQQPKQLSCRSQAGNMNGIRYLRWAKSCEGDQRKRQSCHRWSMNYRTGRWRERLCDKCHNQVVGWWAVFYSW